MEKSKSYFKNTTILLFVIVMAVVLFLIAALSQCSFIKKYPQDNVIEEYLEDLLESKTGLDLDFSPATPEKEKS